MQEILIRDSSELDHQAIVDINSVEVRHTSPMSVNRLCDLDRISAYHRVAENEGKVAAFILAMRENCTYQNENYEWFSSRYPKFLYIDRVVVDAKYFGLRIGTRLYQDIFGYAGSNDIPVIACEYNVIPPNEPSRIFHDKFGFKEVGTQCLANGSKRVSLQAAEVERLAVLR